MNAENTGFFGRLLPFLRTKDEHAEQPLPYRTRDYFLTPAEMTFYRTLQSAAPEGVTVCPKVRLADIFFVSQPANGVDYLAKISERHVDFLLSKAETLRPLLGVELCDSCHDHGHHEESDAFVREVFEAAGLPLVTVPLRKAYSAEELRGLIAPHADREATRPAPRCPKCGIAMVVRTDRGERYYGCRNFPECKESLPYEE